MVLWCKKEGITWMGGIFLESWSDHLAGAGENRRTWVCMCVLWWLVGNMYLYVPLQVCGFWQAFKCVHACACVYVFTLQVYFGDYSCPYICVTSVCLHMKQRDDCCFSVEPLWQVFASARTDSCWNWGSKASLTLCTTSLLGPVIYIPVSQNSTDMFSFNYCNSVLVSKFLFLYSCLL